MKHVYNDVINPVDDFFKTGGFLGMTKGIYQQSSLSLQMGGITTRGDTHTLNTILRKPLKQIIWK